MKKLIYSLLTLTASLLMLGSCSDYLDEEKNFRDQQSLDHIFAKKDYTEQWLANCYTQLLGCNQEIFNYRDEGVTNFSDDMVFHEGGGDNGLFKAWKNGNYQDLQENNSTYCTVWEQSYAGIRQASILIHNVDKNKELTQDEIVDYRGQARFLRAYFYWLLLRTYGPVPVIPDEGLDYSKAYEDQSLPRVPYDSVANYISHQMIQAARELPMRRSDLYVCWPTKGAALAVRAKALLYSASPLANGNKEESDFVDDKGTCVIPQQYDNSKWALAAAAARDIIEYSEQNGNLYHLYTANKVENKTDYAYPSTITPPENAEYSHKNFPEGWADIDPFESYRALFDGDLLASENPEVLFTRGTNQRSHTGYDQNTAQFTMVKHQMPASEGGWNCRGITQKQCDAYDMADGTPFNTVDRPQGFVTNSTVHPYDHVSTGVSMEYVGREPRFYASVAFNGARWACTSSQYAEDRNKQIWYYRGEPDGYQPGSERWIQTGIGFMKFVNPQDNQSQGGTIIGKDEPTIRYADILLMYAEALNEVQGSYTIDSWDGTRKYTITRDVNEMRRGIKPVRMRAGVPDYSPSTYADVEAFRKALKHERQIEFVGENQRFFDLRRWKDAPKEEGAPVYGCNVFMDKDHAQAYYVPVRLTGIQSNFGKRQYFWPIRKSELSKSPRLTQAPGWLNYE